MDVTQAKSEIERAIKGVPTSTQDKFVAELLKLVSEHNGASEAAKPAIEARFGQLRRDVEIASGASLWSKGSMFFVGIVTFLYLLGIFLYMKGLGSDRYASIEATRPILVFTLIVAMLGFGGLLIARALFTKESNEDFEKRFRHAREIFLVFAGIFGTIIGFYFGASDDENGSAPIIQVVTAPDRKVNILVSGGAEPLLGLLKLAVEAGGASFTFEGRELAIQLTADQCPNEAEITVVDGNGRRTETEVAERVEVLNRQGWKCPPESEADGNAADNITSADSEAPGNETGP